MLITSPVKHSIGRQSGDLSIDMQFSVSNTTGELEFGLTGNEGANGFTLKSGRIYSRKGEFVSHYKKNISIPFKMGVSDARANFDYSFYNKANIYNSANYGDPAYQPDYQYLYFNPNGLNVNLTELSLKALRPTMSASPSSVSHTGEAFDVSFQFDSYISGVEFYGAALTNTGGYSIVGSGTSLSGIIGTGGLSLSFQQGSLTTIPQTLSPVIYTSLGVYTGVSFVASGIYDNSNDLIVNFLAGTENIQRDDISLSQILTYNNKSTGNYYVSLEYAAGGTGNILSPASGTGLGTGYVNVDVDGNAQVYSQYITGIIGLSTANGVTVNQSAVGFGYFDVYATGDVSYNYSVEAVGYSGSSFYTGIITGVATGTVLDGSGYYAFDHSFVGVPEFAWNESSVISPAFDFTGVLTKNVIVTGNRQGLFVGPFLGTGNVIEGVKTFTGTWGLETGCLNDTGTYVDYLAQGWNTANEYSNSGLLGSYLLTEGYNNVGIFVTYTNPYSIAQEDAVTLKVGTPVGSFEAVLSGFTPTSYTSGVILPSGGLLSLEYENLLTINNFILTAL